MLSVSDAEQLVHAFMTSRLDYCNALQGGCPASSINKLQILQNAVARVLTRSRKYDHITPILQSSYNASHNLVLQLYLIKRTLKCFSLGWTNIFCLDGTTATLIMSLFVCLFYPMVTRNYTSFSLDPTLKWSEMAKHLRRDDANPSEDLRGSQPSGSLQN